MNMTHPDILQIERMGSLYPEKDPKSVGLCAHCGMKLYDNVEYISDREYNVFCDRGCLEEYYGIRYHN